MKKNNHYTIEECNPILHSRIGWDRVKLNIFLNAEGKSVSPKDQRYIGVLIDDVDAISPYIDTHSCGYTNVKKKFYDRIIPLILKKTKNGYCEDIISGKKFRIKLKGEYDSDSDMTFTDFNLKIDDYKNNPLVLYVKDFYVVDELFKKVFYDYHMGYEGEHMKIMEEIEKFGEKCFSEGLRDSISTLQERAYVENLMFDSEKKLKFKK